MLKESRVNDFVRRRATRLLLASVVAAGAAMCQSRPLTLEEAVQQALKDYPAIQVSLEKAAAAAAAVNLARTSYLPRMDMLAQANRATRNNIFGMLLPQAVISPISGPVLGTSGATSVWGSGVGMLVSWEPFDFGLRRAQTGVAEAARDRSAAAVERTRFEVAAMAADSFLTVLAAEQVTKAAQAGVDRAQSLLTVVEALARAQLRPEADLSRTRAELALAEAQFIQARQAVEAAKASLGQFTGAAPETISVAPGPLLGPAESLPAPPELSAQHPVLAEQQAVIGEVEARRKVLDRSYYPRFSIQGTSYARGSGAKIDGATLGGLNGLAPDIPNWAVGMTVTFPVFDFWTIREKRRIEEHEERSETARRAQLQRELSSQLRKALATLEGARQIPEKTLAQLAAARKTHEQATARYRSGLAGIVELAEAQRLLTQAEIDDSLAKLNVWRAYLAVSSAEGDLTPFLQRAGK